MTREASSHRAFHATSLSTALAAAAAVLVAGMVSSGVVMPLPNAPGRIGGVVPLTSVITSAAMAALAFLAVHRAGSGPWMLGPLAITAAPAVAAGLAAVHWHPTALWIWAGPGVLVAWMMTGAVCTRAVRTLAADTTRPRAHATIACVAAMCWLSGIASGVAEFAVTGDAPHYLTIARSLAVDGDLDLKNDYDERTYTDFYPASLEPRHTNPSPWGEEFSFHGVGVGALVAPGLAAFGVTGATLTLVVLMAGASGLLWLAAWHLLADAGAAWFAWACLVLSAPFALHASAIYPDGPAAAAVAVALWLGAVLQRRSPVSLPAIVLGSIGLAALPWLHVRLAWPAGVLGLGLVAAIATRQPERWTRVAWFLVVPIISLAGWLASTYVMFGFWNPADVMLQRTAPSAWSDAGRGLLGLVADVEFGLIPAAPVMAAALAAALPFARRFPILGGSTVVMAAGVYLMSSLWVWWGGDSAPARFLAVTLPALALWLGDLWARGAVGVRRALSLALAVTAALTVLYATVDGGGRAYTFPDGGETVIQAFSHAVDVSLALPSLFRGDGALHVALQQAAVWAVTLLLAWLVATRAPANRGEGVAGGVAGLGVLLCVTAGVAVGWRIGTAPPATPGTAALAAVQTAAAPAVALAPWPGSDDATWRAMWSSVRIPTPESIATSPPVVLHVPDVPAGRYRIASSGPAPGAGLTVYLGRDAWPFAVPASGEVDLAVAIHSIRVANDSGRNVSAWLEPVEVRSGVPYGTARRATQVGPLVVYSMDDSSYPEASGVWIGGNRPTRLLVETAAAQELLIEAGPADVTLAIDAGDGAHTVALRARATASVPLPEANRHGLVDVRIETHGGFTASELGNASDGRSLGAWLSFVPR